MQQNSLNAEIITIQKETQHTARTNERTEKIRLRLTTFSFDRSFSTVYCQAKYKDDTQGMMF